MHTFSFVQIFKERPIEWRCGIEQYVVDGIFPAFPLVEVQKLLQ
jgi:hypothetical protein